MKKILVLFCFVYSSLLAQDSTSHFKTISINDDDDFDGYELLEIGNNQLFVLAEHWHNIQKVPMATLKLLKYLHQEAN